MKSECVLRDQPRERHKINSMNSFRRKHLRQLICMFIPTIVTRRPNNYSNHNHKKKIQPKPNSRNMWQQSEKPVQL